MIASVRFLPVVVGVAGIMVCGCHIRNQIYRPVGNSDSAALQNDQSEIAVPPPPKLPMPKGAAWPPHPETPCDRGRLAERPCLAFLEFDDFGETWQKNPSGRPSQLQRIVSLISDAKKQDPNGAPLIIAFLHGWKHNASEGNKSGGDDPNIIGFAAVLNELHQLRPGRVIVGIYLAWRGGLISPYWPVSQQFTYWNREATAIRVGNTSLTDALIEISDAARANGDCPNCGPVLVYVGHSFGALALERALSQATVTRMEREWNDANAQAQNDSNSYGRVNIQPLANLVIYVNSAAAATESKQLMDYLASSRYIYHPDNERDEPLFLSVTSEADLATGLALKIGHAVPLLGFKWNGSMRAKSTEATPPSGPNSGYARACFDPSSPNASSTVRFDLSQSDYYMSTTAHLQQLWSHELLAEPSASLEDVPTCFPNQGGNTYMTCRIGNFNYSLKPLPGRCNGTPYWVIQVPKEIIPDHGTIFTSRLIAFLIPFIESAETRPQLSRPLQSQ
jgi:hypothetical protein